MLGIGAVFKNESHIMIEWIEHYLSHGVSDIHLINDQSTDNISSIKNYYKDNQHIIFYDSDVDSGPYCRQIDIYNKYLLPIINKYAWFGIFDLDEFLYSPLFYNLSDALLNISDDVHQIHINWVTFGSNGFINQPTSVVESFNKRISPINDSYFLSHKSLFRSQDLKSIDIHTHYVEGKSENYSFVQNLASPLFLLNHYVIQSKSFFDTVKARRGDVNKIVSTDYRNDSYFNLYDRNDVIDNQLYEQNKDLINIIKPMIKQIHKTISFCQ
jgi:hypothetical protein